MAAVLTLDEGAHPGIVTLRATGLLTWRDYRRVKPPLRRIAAARGPLLVLAELSRFVGWTPAALLYDVAYDLTHQGDFRRIAILGERRWQAGLTRLAAPFFRAEMRFFDRSDAALAWLRR